MKCTVRWINSQHTGGSTMSFLAATESGHLVAMDGAPEGGGRNLAPRPMEMILAGAGGCTAYDVVLILKRGRHAVCGCEVELAAERAPDEPKIFKRIAYHFRVYGHKLAHATVARAIDLSRGKYCSATAMLAHHAQIESSFEIIETGPIESSTTGAH